MQKFWVKNLDSLLKNRYFGAQIFQLLNFLTPKNTTLKLHDLLYVFASEAMEKPEATKNQNQGHLINIHEILKQKQLG